MAAEKELLQGIALMKEGKEEGFNILYSHTYNYVYSRARSVMKTESDAQDLTQETFIQAYKGIAALEDANNVYAWLGGIVFRQGAKLYNKTKKELLLNEDQDYIFEEVETTDADALPEQSAELKATTDVVMGMIDELPELQRSAVVSFYYDHLKIEEIAKVFDCSVNTIKSRLNYAKKFLKSKVEEHQRQYSYKLFSFSPAVLLLALRGLLSSEKYTMAPESAEKVYHVACDTLGITASAVAVGAAGVAAASVTGAGAATTAGAITGTTTATAAGTAALEGAAIGATATASAAGTATTVATAAKAGGLIGKFLAMSTAAKAGVVVLATAVIGGGATTAVLLTNNNPEPPAIVQEVIMDEPEVTMTPEPTATVAPTSTPEPTTAPEPTKSPESDDTRVRDLGGMEIVIGIPYYSKEPDTPEYKALQAYREEMMKKYNFTMREEKIYELGDTTHIFQTATTLGDPSVHVYLINSQYLHHNSHLFYDLSTLSEIDFNDNKWNDAVTKSMSYQGGIYGVSPLTSETPQISGIIYNKRLFEEAGLDPDLPYKLQESGEWTWDNFKKLCAQLTRDTDKDGITDVYATCSYGGEMLEQLLSSTGSQIVTIENGSFVNNAESDNVRKATAFAQELSLSGYEKLRTPDDSWDYYTTAFSTGQAAMQFAQSNVFYDKYNSYTHMTDELGFICCPRMDASVDYSMVSAGYVAVIPAFFDAKTASDIAFAYNLWTNPVPEDDTCDFDWRSLYEGITLDEKILTDTLPYYYEKNRGEVPAHTLVTHDAGFTFYYLMPFADAPLAQTLQELSSVLSIDVAKANTAKKPPVTANADFEENNYSTRVNYDGTVTICRFKHMVAGDLVLPDEINGMPVSEISGDAFSNCGLTSVVLPKGVKRIGEWAFAFGDFTEFVLPDGVTTVASHAITGADLQTVVVPASVTEIGKDAFSSNVALTLVVEKGSYAESYARENGLNVQYKE